MRAPVLMIFGFASVVLLLAVADAQHADGAVVAGHKESKGFFGARRSLQAYWDDPTVVNSNPGPYNVLTSVNSFHPGCLLESANGKCQLVYQCSDGNLVLYRTDSWESLWSSGVLIDEPSVGECELQVDGNLVAKDINRVPYWSSGSGPGLGVGPFTLFVDDTCEVFIKDSCGKKIWSTNTHLPN